MASGLLTKASRGSSALFRDGALLLYDEGSHRQGDQRGGLQASHLAAIEEEAGEEDLHRRVGWIHGMRQPVFFSSRLRSALTPCAAAFAVWQLALRAVQVAAFMLDQYNDNLVILTLGRQASDKTDIFDRFVDRAKSIAIRSGVLLDRRRLLLERQRGARARLCTSGER